MSLGKRSSSMAASPPLQEEHEVVTVSMFANQISRCSMTFPMYIVRTISDLKPSSRSNIRQHANMPKPSFFHFRSLPSYIRFNKGRGCATLLDSKGSLARESWPFDGACPQVMA
jgi:hypothetical protein